MPIWLSAPQVPALAFASAHSGTPAIFAVRPGGIVDFDALDALFFFAVGPGEIVSEKELKCPRPGIACPRRASVQRGTNDGQATLKEERVPAISLAAPGSFALQGVSAPVVV